MRDLVWLYRSTLQKSGLLMRGKQLSEMTRRLAGDRVTVDYVDEVGIQDVRDAAIFVTRSYLADATIFELQDIRSRSNVICADYLDWSPRPQLHPAIDVYIASSLRQAEWYRREYPGKEVHYLPHHVDPDVVGLESQTAFCRIGYFGELKNAKHRNDLEDKVEFFQSNQPGGQDRSWIDVLPEFNVHYNIRDWVLPQVARPPGAFKPFTKGFTAAHCHANMVVPVDESDAAYLLGLDYPYLVRDTSLSGVLEMIEFVADSFGGPTWKMGLQIMDEVRAQTTPAMIVKSVRALAQLCI